MILVNWLMAANPGFAEGLVIGAYIGAFITLLVALPATVQD